MVLIFDACFLGIARGVKNFPILFNNNTVKKNFSSIQKIVIMLRVSSSLKRVPLYSALSFSRSSSGVGMMNVLVVNFFSGPNVRSFNNFSGTRSSKADSSSVHPIKPLLRQVLHIIPPERIKNSEALEIAIENEIKLIALEKKMEYVDIINDFSILESAANRLLGKSPEDVGIIGKEPMHMEQPGESIHPPK